MEMRGLLAVTALLTLVGCSNVLAPEESGIPAPGTVISVGIPASTKTSLGESEGGLRDVYWSDGDQIAVNGIFSDPLSGIPDKTSCADFSFSGVLSYPYNLLYPASVYADASHIILPAVQTYKAGGFADGMFPMAGYAVDGSDIQLKHLCAIIKVSVLRASSNPDEHNITSVRFKGRNAEQVSGSFGLDYATGMLTDSSGADEDKVVKVSKSLATSTSKPVEYFLVVPAGAYTSGFDITVKDSSGHFMIKSKTDPMTLEAGHLYPMKAFEFIPTGTEISVDIN